MLKEPPTSRQMLYFTGERGDRERILPRVLWGRVIPGRLRRRGCCSIFPTSRQSQTMEKKEKSGWQEEVEK